MELLTYIQLIIIAVVTLYLLYEYSEKSVPIWIKTICFAAWFLSFVTIILVPLDVFYSLQKGYYAHLLNNGEPQEQVPEEADDPVNDDTFISMTTCWKVVYWTSFVLTWLILPLLQQYLAAGDFTPKEKIVRAVKANLRTYAAMIICGVIFVVYLKLTGRIGEEGVLQFLITFSNCFGLILIILCLSNGLVTLPKRCLQHSKPDVNLRAHQIQVAVVSDRRQELLFDIEELIKTIQSLLQRRDVTETDKETLNKILSEIPEKLINDAKGSIRSGSSLFTGDFSKKQLDSLNRKVYRKLSELKRVETEYEVTLKRAIFLEDIQESQSTEDWRSKQSYSPPRLGICEGLVSSVEWNWHKHVLKVVSLVTGILLIGFSILVFFAEILNFWNFDLFSVVNILKAGGGALAESQLLCLFPLFYISFCVYSALFRMRLTGKFGLYPHHQTDAPSLIFASLNLSRVTSPIVFNFLQIFQIKSTAFQAVMGDVRFVQSFMKYIPIMLAVLIFCNAFNIFQRFLTSIGLGRYSFNEETAQEKLEEGRKIVNRARGSKSGRSTTYSSFNSTRSQEKTPNSLYHALTETA